MAEVTPRAQLNRTGAFIAACLLVLLGFAIAALVYVQVPVANQNALLVLIGALTTNVTNVVSFFFGSSSTDKKQAETISTLASTAAVAQSALTPSPDAQVSLAPGESVTAKAEPTQ